MTDWLLDDRRRTRPCRIQPRQAAAHRGVAGRNADGLPKADDIAKWLA